MIIFFTSQPPLNMLYTNYHSGGLFGSYNAYFAKQIGVDKYSNILILLYFSEN
jgi:hypothetical protein